MNTEDTEKIKLPKVLRATIAIFLGITFGVHYPISSETKESTYKDMVVVPGLPFLTYYISTLALASFEKDNAFRFDQLEWAGYMGKNWIWNLCFNTLGVYGGYNIQYDRPFYRPPVYFMEQV